MMFPPRCGKTMPAKRLAGLKHPPRRPLLGDLATPAAIRCRRRVPRSPLPVPLQERPMSAPAPFEKNIEAYEAMRETLESQYLHKFVVFHDAEFIDSFDSLDNAAREAVRRFGQGPYLNRSHRTVGQVRLLLAMPELRQEHSHAYHMQRVRRRRPQRTRRPNPKEPSELLPECQECRYSERIWTEAQPDPEHRVPAGAARVSKAPGDMTRCRERWPPRHLRASRAPFPGRTGSVSSDQRAARSTRDSCAVPVPTGHHAAERA